MDIALDIETSGLDPRTAHLVAVGLATIEEVEPRVSRDEAALLHWVEDRLSSAPASARLVTWNGEEFDLPFLATRFRELGIPTSLHVTKRDEVGKYGKPLYTCSWNRLRHVDIAPLYRSVAEARHVKWSLKPVAASVLGVIPVEVDRAGAAIAAMAEHDLARYLRSDIELTLALAGRLERSPNPAENSADRDDASARR